MANPRTCPHCHIQLPVDELDFDEKLNLTCGGCGKIVYPTTPETEQAVFLRQPPTWDQRQQQYPKYGFDQQDDDTEG